MGLQGHGNNKTLTGFLQEMATPTAVNIVIRSDASNQIVVATIIVVTPLFDVKVTI
jgi:hypothetical protein